MRRMYVQSYRKILYLSQGNMSLYVQFFGVREPDTIHVSNSSALSSLSFNVVFDSAGRILVAPVFEIFLGASRGCNIYLVFESWHHAGMTSRIYILTIECFATERNR
jgi:hypothetical protein